MGVFLLVGRKYSCLVCTISEKIILLALNKFKDTKNMEHIDLHQLAMIYRDQGDFHKALKLIEDEEKIIEEHFPNDNLKESYK